MQQAVFKSSWACVFSAVDWDEISHILWVNSHFPFYMADYIFFIISCKFTIYSTNGAISKYVVSKHSCGPIIQCWFSYMCCALCCACLHSSSSLWSFKSAIVILVSV
jgi:hypothetical protein